MVARNSICPSNDSSQTLMFWSLQVKDRKAMIDAFRLYRSRLWRHCEVMGHLNDGLNVNRSQILRKPEDTSCHTIKHCQPRILGRGPKIF